MRVKIKTAKKPIQKENDVALILGDGRMLPQDMEDFLYWKIPHDVISIGRSINLYPGRVHHWANVDGSESKWWAEHLPLKNNGEMPIRHSLGEFDWYDVDWDILDEYDFGTGEQSWAGSSSLFAVLVALEMGYPQIVLAGCPLDSKGHWFFGPEHKGPRWTAETFMAWLEFARTDEAKKVKSLSGYTRQILG